MTKHLHIVAFNTPYPPNYGGVIDIYYKCKTLSDLGVKIHLHCFEYGREHSDTLNKICENVYYYKRKSGLKYLLSSLPYITVTRRSEELLNDLCKDNYPILFEGLHCCYHLNDPKLKDRFKIIRTHNIEHDYYASLAKAEHSAMKRMYLRNEAKKLKTFESILSNANCVMAISPADTKTLLSNYKNVIHVGPFHLDSEVNILPGKGYFALYHGNLEVAENVEAALYLINSVFNNIDMPLVIAGQKPPAYLIEAIKKNKKIELKPYASTAEIYELIKQAQINILPTFQPTGIKLKLLAALYNGRHCVVNSHMAANTGLETICHVKDNPAEMKKAIKELFNTPFDHNEIIKRKEILSTLYNNRTTAEKIIKVI